jgi:hypothetical protein
VQNWCGTRFQLPPDSRWNLLRLKRQVAKAWPWFGREKWENWEKWEKWEKWESVYDYIWPHMTTMTHFNIPSWSTCRRADQCFDLRFDLGSFWPRLHGCGRNWGCKKIQMISVLKSHEITTRSRPLFWYVLIVMAIWRCSAVPKAAKLCLGLPNAFHAMQLVILSIA